jgi:N-methylhydantoinase B
VIATTEIPSRTVDPFTLEIISHRLHQITKEIGTTLERVGGTVNTTQMHDYISALYRPNGDILCAGESSKWHVACAGFAVKRVIERFEDDDGIEPGDMFLLNDPYVAAIHQSDVYIISPIHYGDELIAWSATFVHVTDIGAMSPGGNSPGATEICHEGVRIPGIKLIERGKIRRDVFDAICNMTRQPALVGLDLKCEIAAANVARARMRELCDQYGPAVVDAVSLEMIRYTEDILRKRLLEIPDGRWRATGFIETTETWTVRLELTKRGDHLLFDFSGTDPQAKVGVNLPYHATYGKCFGALLNLLAWDIPKNHGAFAPIEVIAPPGTLVNVQPPGPVSLSTTSGGSVVGYVADLVMTEMVAGSQKWSTEVIARGMGSRRARHAGINQHGWYYVSNFNGIGGSGARSLGDGIDCGGATGSSHNVEWFESLYPFLYLYRRQIKDAGGPGRFRGGAGDEMAVVLHDAPEGRIKIVPYGVGGLRNSGQGLFGGYPGAPGNLSLGKDISMDELFAQQRSPDLLGAGVQTTTLPHHEFDLRPNDVLIRTSGGGGGYGDPLDRPSSAVVADVYEGVVSAQTARDIYGVVLDGEGVDFAATEALREQLRAERRTNLERPGGGIIQEQERRNAPADHPLRENLEVAGGSIRCTRCKNRLCAASDDWVEACSRKLVSASKAGALREAYAQQFVVEQLYCPSCAVLLETQILEI